MKKIIVLLMLILCVGLVNASTFIVNNLEATNNITATGDILANAYYGDGSNLANLPAGSTPSVNLTTQFGGEVTGTYDAIVLQWLTADWFDNELNQTSSPTFSAVTTTDIHGIALVNATTSFGGEVTGTYDAIVLQWLTADWFDNELNQSSSPTFNTVTASSYSGVPSVNITTNFGGEVTGTYDAIVLQWLTSNWFNQDLNTTNNVEFADVTASDDIYVNDKIYKKDDTTNYLLFTTNGIAGYAGNELFLEGRDDWDTLRLGGSFDKINFTTGGTSRMIVDDFSVIASVGINVTSGNDICIDGGNCLSNMGSGDWLTSDYFDNELNQSSSPTFSAVTTTNIHGIALVNASTSFGGEVTGTYDAIVLQWLTANWFDNELNQSSSPTFAAVTTTAIHGISLVNASTNFGGEVSGTYDAMVLQWLTADWFNQNLNTTNTVTFNNITTTVGISVGGEINMHDDNINEVDCIKFTSGGQICSG